MYQGSPTVSTQGFCAASPGAREALEPVAIGSSWVKGEGEEKGV